MDWIGIFLAVSFFMIFIAILRVPFSKMFKKEMAIVIKKEAEEDAKASKNWNEYFDKQDEYYELKRQEKFEKIRNKIRSMQKIE